MDVVSAVNMTRSNHLEDRMMVSLLSSSRCLSNYWYSLHGMSLVLSGSDLEYVVEERQRVDRVINALEGGLQS